MTTVTIETGSVDNTGTIINWANVKFVQGTGERETLRVFFVDGTEREFIGLNIEAAARGVYRDM